MENATIDQLKETAINELNAENSESVKNIAEPEIIEGLVISYEELSSKLEEDNKAEITKQVQNAMESGDFDKAREVLSAVKSSINSRIFALPSYFLYEVNGDTFLVKVPDKVSANKSKSSKTTKFVVPFSGGDKIQLVKDDVKSPVYTYSPAGAIDPEGNVHKFSYCVGLFFETQLHKSVMRLPSGNGYNIQGISHNYWTKVN